MNVTVYTEGTGKISDEKIAELVNAHFDLRPKGIIRMLDLLRPIYRKTAAYGHFGRDEPEFTWENHGQGRSAARRGRHQVIRDRRSRCNRGSRPSPRARCPACATSRCRRRPRWSTSRIRRPARRSGCQGRRSQARARLDAVDRLPMAGTADGHAHALADRHARVRTQGRRSAQRRRGRLRHLSLSRRAAGQDRAAIRVPPRVGNRARPRRSCGTKSPSSRRARCIASVAWRCRCAAVALRVVRHDRARRGRGARPTAARSPCAPATPLVVSLPPDPGPGYGWVLRIREPRISR